jgi:thiol-disulfide isomerase/thioredoxin
MTARAVAVAMVVACGAAPKPIPPPPKDLQLNTTGAMVDVATELVAGYVTIVDFWSESCGACVEVGGKVAVAIADQPKVLLRKIDVGDGFTPVAHAYEIGALPHYNIYDRNKRLRYILVGGDCLRAPDLARELLAEP